MLHGVRSTGRYRPPRELVVRGSAPRDVKPPDFDLDREVVASILLLEGTGAH